MAQVVVVVSRNNPPPSDPTQIEPAHKVRDNHSVSCIITKIQPCDLEPTFESTNPTVVSIIDLGVSHGNLVVILH